MNNIYIQVFVHWLHIISAIMALGGSILLRIAVHPAMSSLDAELRAKIEHTLMPKARKVISRGVLLLIVTGVFNVIRIFSSDTPLPSSYTLLLAIKVFLAFALMGLTIALLVPSEAFEKIQARRPFWMTINIFLGLTIVLISVTIGLMRDSPEFSQAIEASPTIEFRDIDLGGAGGAVASELDKDR